MALLFWPSVSGMTCLEFLTARGKWQAVEVTAGSP